MPATITLPLLFTRAEAEARGASRHQVTRRVAARELVQVRRGWYVESQRFEALNAEQQHLVRVVAALRGRDLGDVGSHLSAALVHGWPMPFDGPGPPTITSPQLRRTAQRRDRVVVQVATLRERDVVERTVHVEDLSATIRVTGPARTLADCLRHLPNEDAVGMADAVVRSGSASVLDVAAVLEQQEAWPYLVDGRRGLALVDPRRESFLESYSFVRLAHRGITVEPQVSVHDAAGRFVGRVDGWIADGPVALEADGVGKYLPADGAGTREVVRAVRLSMAAELARERRLRDLGVTVVRWGADEAIRRPDRLAARVRAATTSDRAPFTGRALPRTFPR